MMEIKFRNPYTEVIKREEKIHNVDNNVNTFNDIIIKKFNKILYELKQIIFGVMSIIY
jgi:ASC-1-like (ASCH) protein